MLRTTTALTAILTVLSGTAMAEQGDILVRARAILVAPQDDASGIQPGVPTGSVTVEDAVVPELDFTYMLRDNVGVELILATSPHDLKGTGAISALGEVGDVWALPPTLTLQYHFAPTAKIRPYIGAGVNYTIFYEADATSSLRGALGPTKIELDDSFGFALQAGVDVQLNDTWFANADIKYIDIDTEAELNSGGTINTIDVDIDPLVVGIGIGRKF